MDIVTEISPELCYRSIRNQVFSAAEGLDLGEYHRLDPVSLRPFLGEWMKGLTCRLRGDVRTVLCRPRPMNCVQICMRTPNRIEIS